MRDPSETVPRSGWRVKAVFAGAVAVWAGQFLLNWFRAEPYPTLLLPDYAGLYHEDPEGIVYEAAELVAIGDGRRTPFDCTEAFPDFGPAYCSHIVGKNFGLRHVGRRQNPARIGPISVPAPTGVTTEAEAEETRLAVRQRLGELVGHGVDSVEVWRTRYRARYDTGRRERLEVLSRRAFSLRRGEAW